ncbi:hypothetical protein QWY90_01020 [Flavobacterium paronense]|uniref:hypothetical protein n=1 Tax=Flavobacterium paronense TaxID=1392775 RepID=UPI0025B55EA6|nr:hypothetical protein [Flavobacterium paronense]MDN3675907.1 hypothetical protein [Flavobacterium paronense]
MKSGVENPEDFQQQRLELLRKTAVMRSAFLATTFSNKFLSNFFSILIFNRNYAFIPPTSSASFSFIGFYFRLLLCILLFHIYKYNASFSTVLVCKLCF